MPPATPALPAVRPHAYRTPFMLGIMGVGMALLIHDSITHLGWISAARWSYGLLAAYAFYTLLTRDAVVARILGFALAAGVAELAADAYLVSVTHTLLYPRPEPMLWDSPAYMPVSWAVVLTQIGYIGWLIPWPTWRTGLLLVPVSGLLIPLYESWAIHAGWWAYHQAPNWWGVPHYIYLAEALLVLPVPTLLARAVGGGRWAWLPTGLAEGLVMLLACVIAFTLAG